MFDNGKSHKELTVMEAVEHLSSLAELDLKSPQAVSSGKINWLDSRHGEEKRETIKQAFRVINNYLHHLYEKDKGRLKDAEMQRGVQSIMALVSEAAQKLDRYTSFFKGSDKKTSVTHIKEYQDLQKYYLTKIINRFQKSLETEEAWQQEWGNLDEESLDVQKQGLKDLETVRRDKEYELFYIKRDDGRPFFNKNLLRHIKLVGDFDETLTDPTGEDPFLRLKVIQDREIHDTAREILENAAPYLDSFYKEALRYKDIELASNLNKALMALMLCANARNLLQNTSLKICMSYFHDFQIYFRQALTSPEYKKIIGTPFDQLDKFSHSMLNLIYTLSSLFFTRQGGHKDAVALIKRLIEKGRKPTALTQQGVRFWDALLDEDDQIRYLLKHYPNGPLLKTLDAFREGEESEGFDPLIQENLPSQIFSIAYDSLDVSCLRIPSPTRQSVINKAELVDEFVAFIRSTNTKAVANKHLLINLQDRTSWQEHARSIILEEMHRKAEFSSNMCVVTLPKNTDFYLQADTYQNLDEAELFMAQVKEQVLSAEECGFYFPLQLKTEEFFTFVDAMIKMIHVHFFEAKKMLTREERLNFIELFYCFLILKSIDLVKPDSISLTCKDAIDTGSAASAGFFAFLKILSQNAIWTQEDKDRLLWMLYAPALFIRERAIDPQVLHRTVSMMATLQTSMETHGKDVLKALCSLFSYPIFNDLKVS
ncbi:MAG: hypothetical protein V4494_05880 [Chlamydiota bacterium]